jgi:NAD(P)-dependent dehydrogenase (short-subunit alcohol dehydrogenase family)
MNRFEGRVAAVVGAGPGMSRAIARQHGGWR